MKILMVSEDLPGEQLGGLAKHVVTLSNALLEAGHQVDIMGRSDRAHAASAAEISFQGRFIPGFDFRRVGWKETQLGFFNPAKRPWFAAKVARAFTDRARDYDVIHYHGHLPMIGLYVDPALNFVQTRHDQGSECVIHLRFKEGAVCTETDSRACAGCAHPMPGALRTALSGHAVARYRGETARAFARHKTIFVSDFLRRQFLRTVPGADLSRARVIHNFINYRKLAAYSDAAGAPRDGQVLVAGRIDTGKGFAEFLAAARGRLPPHAQVLVVGDGPLRAGLEAQYASAQIRFLGWQPNPEVVALAAASHACVVPSVWEEPCGTTILEALALGRPCLALARGGNPELSVYESSPGQLRLATSMDALVVQLAEVLAQPATAQPRPGAAGAGMDVFQALPKIVEFYAQ
ncbi:glycosyltransferase family 4 protein [Telluria aromaticivorans]|uniref:Glycosyltransferase family 4 protein n=1 Tax=Telluria aromaticivorans TaxID=2725995 RepID=A0A7Y2P1F1_9BURK|nr:glycosyltransferase family 4 protein [Telluria aromaticivorans]NNG23804.1 glycosyltransferase family 4 protein [Telluria aromaticivorans]